MRMYLMGSRQGLRLVSFYLWPVAPATVSVAAAAVGSVLGETHLYNNWEEVEATVLAARCEGHGKNSKVDF